MELNPYLHFDGNCEEALQFYSGALHGEIAGLHRYEGSPMEAEVGEANKHKVMHATLVAGRVLVMAADVMTGDVRGAQSNVSLSLSIPDRTEARRTFEALSQGGSVNMPLQDVFWGGAFGAFADRYGINWMISSE